MTRRTIHMPADTDLNHLYEMWHIAGSFLDAQGLKAKGWKVVFDNTKRRAGQCRYNVKEIGLSAHLFSIWTYDHCKYVIIHEIAHALCPDSGHNKVWQAQCISLGGNGKRCWGSDGEAKFKRRPAKYIGECPNGHEFPRWRRPKNIDVARRSCATCNPDRFDTRYLITWKENI